ncbi:MAG: hypothetical protein ACJ75R_03520 [Solirubrobacterales bacterium]
MAASKATTKTNTTKAQTATSTQTAKQRSDARQIREGVTKARNGAVNYVRQTAERSVDLPVGAALAARDRVTEVVEPWTAAETRDRELKSLRTQVTRELNRFERRGGQARRKANTRVRQTRNRLEREVKQRRRSIERQVKQNRARVEKAVKQNRRKAEQQLKKAQNAVQDRVGTTQTAS